MMDPTRLEEGGATAFERQLLDAAKRQAPGSALKARMQEGLGLAGATVPVQAVVAKTFALGMGWKANVVLALIVAGASVTVPLVLRNQDGTSPAQPDESARTPPPATPLPLPADDPAGSKTPPAGAATTAAAGTLTEEIRLLDRVRGAMSAGAPRRALAELQRYDQKYPQGAFGPEATVLRIEALDTAGDSRLARTLGRQFLARHPRNPLADRVARIVQR